jgi:4-amino-4-deoxy-L-arabinose transferase-like glycosyltransferase
LGNPTPAQRNFDRLYISHPRRWVVVIVLASLLLATNFALNTPRWQAPDEPAHFNYIAHIANEFALPVLRMGDYDQDLLNLLVRTGLRSEPSVARLTYESYQPPLFYLFATPVYWLSGGSLAAVRLFNVLLGVGVIVLIYRTLELAFQEKALITVSATAFVAFLPMHLAVMAAVNNDILAELLIIAALFVLLDWMKRRFDLDQEIAQQIEPARLLWLGLLLGLGLLTKIYAYALLPVALATILLVIWRRNGTPFWSSAVTMLWAGLPALLLALPWWVRNWRLYGPWDLLGTAWHDQVVAGQPRTVDWIAEFGWDNYLERALSLTFRSFWGVFGWLGVVMDERIYIAFLLFSGVIFLGVLWALVRLISGGQDMDMDDYQLWVLALFAAVILAVFASYIWYNTKFVQHQGRYLFWGLAPISAYVALGWREVLRPLQGLITGILALVLALSLVLVGYATGEMQEWTIAIAGALGLFLLCQPILLIGTHGIHAPKFRFLEWLASATWFRLLTAALRTVVWALPFLLLALLDLLIPTMVILPQLTY